MIKLFGNVIRENNVSGLYNGLSASLFRQGTYSLTRFAIYETFKEKISQKTNKPLLFYQKVCLAGFSGFVGGIVGNPGDMVNVRMQNDMRLPIPSYKHVFDGLVRVLREEGTFKVFNGVTMTSTRGLFITIGQISIYEQVKEMLLKTKYFNDNTLLHFISSFVAVVHLDYCREQWQR
ncbi:mitochondrial dicarboxylate carrier-like [Octopus sinensis]|uniref:Mitochondrial dicarboxylate carrier-like n=1 Tax=Octopus sinensis TaxID=2607531 RepID=A0A7E6EM54_9MOLL|nr:mitochondrial dicarboxylate carrier-like [Octopus sinensis]